MTSAGLCEKKTKQGSLTSNRKENQDGGEDKENKTGFIALKRKKQELCIRVGNSHKSNKEMGLNS